jgi:hypothetical protein
MKRPYKGCRTNNLYPKNAVDIVHEETNPKVPSVKRKTKQSNKSKDISDRATTMMSLVMVSHSNIFYF